MKNHTLYRIVSSLVIVILIAPSAFLLAPQPARAQLGVPVAGIGWNDIITAVKSTLSTVLEMSIEAATIAQYVNTYVLQPLAFIMSGNLLKMLTASVIDFVIGATNGTGAPQFVQDLQGNLQRVGDIQANAFFIQFGRNSNSPFAGAITSSLRTNYLWNTSSAGFFAANRNTMARYSPNPNAFLNGNWSQGGVGAWFALTTQSQNNPYTFYQASQSHLASIVGGATAARLAELNWGQGMLSWCSRSDDGEATAEDTGDDDADSTGVSPGDGCFNKDGTPGTIMTPGSTIKATLDKVLGGTQDKLVQIGQLAKEVGGILGNVGTVFSTINFASQILGGSGSGGLFGVGQTSATNPTSRLVQFQNTPTLGVSQSTVLQNASTLPMSGSDMSSRLNQYESSWNTIRSSATSATASLNSLANFCDNAVATAQYGGSFPSVASSQAVAARSAITTQIAPIIAQANTASTVIANARSAVQTLQSQLNSGVSGASNTYAANVTALQNMPPSTLDVSNMQLEVQAFGVAVASPPGSLNVSGGTIMDRLNLISTNSSALKTSVCVEPTPEEAAQSGGGGSGGGGSNDG